VDVSPWALGNGPAGQEAEGGEATNHFIESTENHFTQKKTVDSGGVALFENPLHEALLNAISGAEECPCLSRA
jgi:hypothetical protein